MTFFSDMLFYGLCGALICGMISVICEFVNEKAAKIFLAIAYVCVAIVLLATIQLGWWR